MKYFIVIRFWTPNELGGTGSLTDCEIFKNEEEAVEYVRKESGGKEPEKNKIPHPDLYNLCYDTEWDNDIIKFYIIEKEL